MRILRLLSAVATLLLLTSCASGNPGDTRVFEPDTTWGTPDAPGEPWITFGPMGPYGVEHEDGIVEKGEVGEFVGSDGCNSLGGKYSYMSSMASIEGPMTTTEMWCEGVDTWLAGFSQAEIEGDELVVYGGEGEEIGRLPRNQ